MILLMVQRMKGTPIEPFINLCFFSIQDKAIQINQSYQVPKNVSLFYIWIDQLYNGAGNCTLFSIIPLGCASRLFLWGTTIDFNFEYK